MRREIKWEDNGSPTDKRNGTHFWQRRQQDDLKTMLSLKLGSDSGWWLCSLYESFRMYGFTWWLRIQCQSNVDVPEIIYILTRINFIQDRMLVIVWHKWCLRLKITAALPKPCRLRVAVKLLQTNKANPLWGWSIQSNLSTTLPCYRPTEQSSQAAPQYEAACQSTKQKKVTVPVCYSHMSTFVILMIKYLTESIWFCKYTDQITRVNL